MTEATLDWRIDGEKLRLGLTRRGDGPLALLLPALSSISTRAEMGPLAERLAPRFQTLAVDWPGFGDLPRPRRAWSRADMAAFLAHLLAEVAPRPALVVAAGHAAGYLLAHPDRDAFDRAALIAPTWRGPLPTMLARRPDWLARVRAAVDAPVIGPMLYALNLSRPVIRRMARGHVYADPAFLAPDRFPAKLAVADAPGARFASVRFVTGALDPFDDGATFRAAGAALGARLTLVWGAETPGKSRAEMGALADAAGVTPTIVAGAKLGVHEERPNETATAILEG
ncbi:alpha/beta fold hydrolase [Rubrimonas cliftonensis]|uniref:Pimeloyl-ACP methyl ester carboxylesterase n=1 Tax=Rubrimonas cliftonensis TaxID=89524 RepID=A0A1H4G8H1_9RHOB|nr:alpha/beta hydrolase [Rubrimonas cliftonensis]SEB05953.1 Pimeloyl-ACP methyl ester carboxylesterase [Rubrimonas cliftonensis]